MCGIAGFIGKPVDSAPQRLTLLADRIAHRGPDGDGSYLAAFDHGRCQVGLAHRRLSIIDIAGGAQPFSNVKGSIQLVFNGEIYNYKALRAELRERGHVFRSDSDTETIVVAYEAFGLDFVDHLRGMFAFALWDADREQLVLARDRYGEKPLLYFDDGSRLVFASELKAMLAWPEISAVLEADALPYHLQYRYVPSPLTLIRGVRKLPAGTLSVWSRGRLEEFRYYTPPDSTPRRSLGDPRSYVEQFQSKLDESVALMMQSDVPFGAFLSGGIDSSAIVALMARHSSEKINTFSVGFDRAGYSELDYAAVVAREFGTRHHELAVSEQQVTDLLAEAPLLRDGPVAEPADIPVLMLAREARRSVKMVLTGEGSDEALGGYPKHVYERFAALYATIPRGLRQQVLQPLLMSLPYGARRVKTATAALAIEDFDLRMPRWFGALSKDEVGALCSGHASAEPINGSAAVSAFPFQSSGAGSALRRILFFDQTSWLPDNLLERGDRLTMAAGIEARMPFMDYQLIELVSSFPDEWRVRGFSTKRILRMAMAQLLPKQILQRRKVGFRTPVHLWFRGGTMRELLQDALGSSGSLTAELLDRGRVLSYLQEHLDGRQNHEKLLWMLLSLELWARAFRIRA